MQRRGVPFTGFVPTTGMTTPDASGNYDFSGAPTLAGGGFLNNPFGGAPFQCLPGTSTPEPVLSDGSPVSRQSLQHRSGRCGQPGRGEGASALSHPECEREPVITTSMSPCGKLNEGTWDIRLDHKFSSKDSIFGRFSYDQATNFIPGGSPTWTEQNAFGSNQYIDNHGRNAVISETHVFSATTINQVTFGYQPHLQSHPFVWHRHLRGCHYRNSRRGPGHRSAIPSPDIRQA